jgi:hypothetical protein
VYTDKDFEVTGYVWVGAWYMIFIVNQVRCNRATEWCGLDRGEVD